MKIIKISKCSECPCCKIEEADWDYKDQPVCGKTGKKLTNERIDRRFNKRWDLIPVECPLEDA